MNKRDRANLDLIVKLAEQLLNAGDTGSGILNIDVLEATLADIGSALGGKSPFELQKLVARDEAQKQCACPHAKSFHYNGCAVLVANFKGFTADGHRIVDALEVWDYNLEPGIVNLSRLSDDGWFEVRKPGSHRGVAMNAERVSLRHPTTGQLASDALKFGVGYTGPTTLRYSHTEEK